MVEFVCLLLEVKNWFVVMVVSVDDVFDDFFNCGNV